MSEQHRAAKRDPTIPLVIGLLLVIGIVVALTRMSSGDAGVAAAPVTTPSPSPSTAPPTAATTTAPTTSPTVSVSPTPSGPLTRAGAPVCVQQQHDTDLTVVDWNIKSGQGGGSLAQIAGTLKAAAPDVVLLQEVDVNRGGSFHGVDMPAYLGAALGMYHQFGENVPHGPSAGYGTAILSKYPIVSWENTHLPRPGNTQQRGLLHVVLDVDGKEVSVYDTHLQNLVESARVAQMHTILSIVSQDPRPQIFGGDFNSQPNSTPSSLARTHFTDTWGTVGVGTGRTHPANHLRGRIDYLYNANAGITPLASDVLPARLSDHMAVRAQYRVAAPDTQVCVQMLQQAPNNVAAMGPGNHPGKHRAKRTG